MGNCSVKHACGNEICCKDSFDTDREYGRPIQPKGFDAISTQIQATSMNEDAQMLLELEVVSSNVFGRGVTFVITPNGLSSSSRVPRDGITYFGCKKRAKLPDGQQGPIVNDIIMPLEDPNSAELSRGRHFQISYDSKTEGFYLLDLGLGFGCYLKLTHPIALADEQLIQVGKTFLVLKLVYADESDLPRLDVRVYGSAESSVSYSFPPRNERLTVGIGRQSDSDVLIADDDLLSKRQATMLWNSSQWILADGDLEHPSTNGTW